MLGESPSLNVMGPPMAGPCDDDPELVHNDRMCGDRGRELYRCGPDEAADAVEVPVLVRAASCMPP